MIIYYGKASKHTQYNLATAQHFQPHTFYAGEMAHEKCMLKRGLNEASKQNQVSQIAIAFTP